MIYTYCKDALLFKKVSPIVYLKAILAAIVMISVTGYFMYIYGIKNSINEMSVEERITLVKENDPFSKEKMASMLGGLNVKFPWIPMAQSMLETGHWKSDIFFENHNLFGMKEARARITTAIGTNKNHAEYNTWRESVYDYAFYQNRYLNTIKTEGEYYQYLAASYAEDPKYISKVKDAVERYKLKQLFN
jgi:hypothetical protein